MRAGASVSVLLLLLAVLDARLRARARQSTATPLALLRARSCTVGFPELVRSLYDGSPDVVRFGANVWSKPWERLPWVFNCNFEVVSLARFRSPHYRAFWAHVNDAGLFWATRLGDHQVKTLYVETFEPEEHVVCYGNLPYGHPNDHADGGPCGDLHVGRTRWFAQPSALRALLRWLAAAFG